MNKFIFDRKKRQELLVKREEMILQYVALENEYELTDEDDPREKIISDELSRIGSDLLVNIDDYYQTLPNAKLSECPFTGQALSSSFDPVGLDGLWWMEFTRKPTCLVDSPPTFRLLRGAVNLAGIAPKGGRHNALIGPGVPYVIPRILQLPTMRMVISQITLENGYAVYLLAYFSSEKPLSSQLTSAWLEKDEHYHTDSNGKYGWSVASEYWDFNIENWIKLGKIYWIRPGENNLSLPSVNPADCPFVNVSGSKLPQVIKKDEIFTRPLPNPVVDKDIFN